MLDDVMTYGGWAVGLVAVGVWTWLARRAFPSFESFVRGFDDELQLGASPEERALASGPSGRRGADGRRGPVPVDRVRDSRLSPPIRPRRIRALTASARSMWRS
jgi:hypothetical protein